MTAPIRAFLALDPERQLLYLGSRRCGIFSRLTQLDDAKPRVHAQRALVAHRVTRENVNNWAAEMMQRFI